MTVEVAIFSSHGLGDGLIQLVLANNLHLNGYKVCYYSDFIHQLNDYIADISVLPFPEYSKVQQALNKTHIILYDSNSRFVSQMPAELDQWFASNGICYSNARSEPRHKEITVEQLQNRLPLQDKALAAHFIQLNRSYRSKKIQIKRPPIAHQLVNILAQYLDLKVSSHANGLFIPEAKVKSDSRRIVIHPTSSSVIKDWTIPQFEQLAERLIDTGWNPVFTVSPAEREHWLSISNERFEVPEFDTIKKLAEFYRSSVAFVGNDSGNAHLASCLGLPNLVIFNRWRKYPLWRPAWGKTYTVYPRTLVRKNWQQKVSVDRVFNVFEKMMLETNLSST